ncbi:MAG: rod shape-determining protein RodA [Clostridia bacterium]|nr:rod shape-determining protein RodA [Clostridia bacterium]
MSIKHWKTAPHPISGGIAVERKVYIKNLDYVFLACVLGILVMSGFVLSSATLNVTSDPFFYVKRQVVWIILGIISAILVNLIDYNSLRNYAKFLYVFNILILLFVIAVGKQRSWIPIGPFLLQPSEFAKVIVIITFAKYLTDRQGKLNTLKDLIPCFIHVGIPMVLVMFGDLGTSLVFAAILFGMLFVGGANPKLLLYIIFSAILIIVMLLVAHFNFGLPLPLEEYQLMRLVVFLDPYNDGANGQGAGYHIIQSQVAIGSGGLLGKGLYQGSQVQLNFLPEHHTDFIFSVVGEELGFLGACALLTLYFGLIYRGLNIASRAKDMFGTLLVAGVISMIFFHVLENVGMTVGLMPITGIPLPLFSYGGSSMLATMTAIGLVLNVNVRRQTIRF